MSRDDSLNFDCDVAPNGGYVWWYVDAISDDGTHGLTMIAFVGSVFSPYYAWNNWADPLNHCAINVALYRVDGAGGAWAMTERGGKSLTRSPTQFALGPSSLTWQGGVLTAHIDERCAPIPTRLTGQIRIIPEMMTDFQLQLDPAGHHFWRPLAPKARVELAFAAPDVHWSGDGYLDSNHGAEPLERAFTSWHWGRAHCGEDALILYDVSHKNSSHSQTALRINPLGQVTPCPSPPTTNLPSTFWRVPRQAWCDGDGRPTIQKTLEDTPFYTRTALTTRLNGEDVTMMHESLSLTRLQNPVIRAMLMARMPRALI
ncbi:MAG: hypothetical protein RLZZ157_184 [Pseudomonadota bacterium]|jgi:carotenoid 1,2-hydratase